MLKDKDISQRTLGFISFSFLFHIGLITATFLIPNVLKESKPGTKSETYLVESPSQASLGESAQAGPAMMPPPIEQTQVMTAPVDDSSAIVVAKSELPQKLPAAKKAIIPAREKAETATKKVLALPAKKLAPAKATVARKVETVDQSDLEVQQALKSARESEETLPEVAADIEVPEVTDGQEESASTEATETTATEVAPAATEVVTEEPAVESATTTSNEEESASLAQPAPQPIYAPIQRGAQQSRPSGQVGGLGTAGAPTTPTVGTGGIRDADSLREQPGNAKPSYADEDQRSGREGVVVFDAMVTKDGTVQAIQLKKSSGHSSLDSSAYEAFKKHRYQAGQEGSVRKTFQFVLNGEKTLPGKLRRR